MVVLGAPELSVGYDLGGEISTALVLAALLARRRDLLLMLIVVEDDRPVLSGYGAVDGRVVGPEDVQQFLIADGARVVVDLDRLTVAAEVVVGGVALRPARVADACANDAGETPEPGVRTPESPHGEGRRLRLCGCIQVDGRQAGRPLFGRRGTHSRSLLRGCQ